MSCCSSQVSPSKNALPENFILYTKPFSPAKPGETAVYRAPRGFDGLIDTPDGECFTMQDEFLRAVRIYGDRKFLGSVDKDKGVYVWKTYKEVKQLAEKLGSNITKLKLFTRVNEFENIDMSLIGIFSKNREEWLELEYSNFLYHKTLVPFYDTLGPETITYILKQTEISTIFCSGEGVDSILKSKDLAKLKNMVLFDAISSEKRDQLISRGLKLYEFQELLKDTPIDAYSKVVPNDIVTFSYTSGTTGDPKGALITHKNLVSVTAVGKEENILPTDSYLSYLPLPHILERIAVSTFMYSGGCIGFYRGDTRTLKDDLALLKPSTFASVPRVYNKFYDLIKTKFDSATGISAWLIKKGLATKIENAKKGIYTHALWDRLVFNKVRDALGGNVRYAVVGGAPISGEVLTFLRAVLCAPIQEGYGQTESTGACFSANVKDGVTGQVGGTRANMEFKLVDIPEMGYTSKDIDASGKLMPRGEICTRGNGVCAGYYKQKDKTAELIDSEGWIHSGDVGMLNPVGGNISIIDRKKNIFKLSQGEYIAPDKIENIYLRAPGVEEVFIYGDSLQSTLIAVVVPCRDYLLQYAKTHNLQTEDIPLLCKDKELTKTMLTAMNQLAKKEGLFSFEQAKSLLLFSESLKTIDGLTSTLKIKRKQCRDYFRADIDRLYAEQPVQPS